MKRIFSLLSILSIIPYLFAQTAEEQKNDEICGELSKKLSYMTGYSLAQYLNYMNSDEIQDVLRRYYDPEAMQEGFAEGLFGQGNDDTFDHFDAVSQLLWKVLEAEKEKKFTTEMSRILSLPEFGSMEAWGDSARYEIIFPGTGELIPDNQPYVENYRTLSSSGRVRYEENGHITTWSNIGNQSLSAIYERLARVGACFRVVYTDRHLIEYKSGEDGELPVLIFEIEILRLSDSEEMQNYRDEKY
ncbi:MAG: hypothetical protein LIO79_04135 [Rikenellaceae bacterium]|nr:hypothetical protein [Rikenellaceae bacterium]